jgi:hypothetical protein
MITICFTYFKSLTLENLRAALYSVRTQDLALASELVIVDNATADSEQDIQAEIDSQHFPIPTRLCSVKHGDPTREQAWSTNLTVRQGRGWVFYTRADYLLDPSILNKFSAVVACKPTDWDGFIVSHGCHLGNSIGEVEQTTWRTNGTRVLNGIVYDYTEVDSGVWMARRETFDRVGGFDERLSSWGHAQTEFQYRMFGAGVEFVRIPETLFYHPAHGGAKDMDRANQQLATVGTNLKMMWARYHGESPYGR